MSTAKGYLRYRRATLALYGLAAVIFPLAQWLYGQPLAPVGYGLLMLTFLLLVGLCADFARYRAKTQALGAVLENVSEAEHDLPEAGHAIEAQYQALALALYDLLDRQAERLSQLHSEQVDYYTLWVHQVKTPLSAIQLALQGDADPALLAEELFKIERYIEMALQFAKLENLSGDLVPRTVDVGPVVSGAVKKYATLFIGKKLSVRIENVDFQAETDSKWLAFILEQLLSNAVKYTQRGGVTIRGEGHSLTISDTGVGITPEDLARIFEKGYTGYNGRMDQRASGLGLYMVRRVADQLGIRVFPESTPGAGTRMTLVLPVRRHVE